MVAIDSRAEAPGRMEANLSSDSSRNLSKSESALVSPGLATALVAAMSDEYSRRILSSAIAESKSVEEICVEQGIPQSSGYKRIRDLVGAGAMVIDKMVVPTTGKKFALYRSSFKRVDLSLENGVLSAYAVVNPEVADKLEALRRAIKGSGGDASPLIGRFGRQPTPE